MGIHVTHPGEENSGDVLSPIGNSNGCIYNLKH